MSMALRSFREGDKVKAVVLSADTEKRRISFGLKPSYFADEDFQEQGESSEGGEPQFLGVVDEESDEEALEDSDAEDENEHDEGSDEEEEEDGMNVDVDIDADAPVFARQSVQTTAGPSAHHALNLGAGFQWSLGSNDDDVEMQSSSEGEDEEGQTSKKKKRKHKEIEQDLTADLQSKTPESNADFERILLGSPNSSYLWMQYMSFQLHLSEIDRAREIAQRALKTINFREEQEKLNVWIALLNLENVYGTEESLETAFKDAARHNDSKTIHIRLAAIFDQSEKTEVSYISRGLVNVLSQLDEQKAEDQYKRTCKKFGQSSKVWTLFAEHYLRLGKPEEARSLLPRSLQSLEKRKRAYTLVDTDV